MVRPALLRNNDSTIDMKEVGLAPSSCSSNQSDYGDPDFFSSGRTVSHTGSTSNAGCAGADPIARTATWAALVGYIPQTDDAGGDIEQQLLKTPICGCELEAIERLHDQVKTKVTKRASFGTDEDTNKMWSTAAEHAELLSKIPPGFAIKIDDKSGMLYVVDHVKKTTHWQMPGYRSIRTIRQVVPKSIALREAAAEAAQSVAHSLALSADVTDVADVKVVKGD